MRALVGGVAVGKIQGVLVVDVDELEDMYGEADMPVAAAPDIGEITLLQLNGVLTREEFRTALSMALRAIDRVVEFEKEAIRRTYLEVGGGQE